MVKVFLMLSLFVFSAFAEDEVIEIQDPLMQKVKSFVSEEEFSKNESFIKLIFSPQTNFYRQDRVDAVKVAQTLKENGLLKLFFVKPQELKLSFKTSASPLFFVKIMGDTLRNMGYYRYVTMESNLDSSEFTWTIVLKAEYATDPLLLQAELQKSGCGVIDIKRHTKSHWEYSIDMSQASLNIPSLQDKQEMQLKRSLYAHWLNVSNIQSLKIKSSFRDHWYPKISYYNKQLHLLKVIQEDTRTRTLFLVVPSNARYIKIDDMYTLKNVKDKLTLEPKGHK
ncbi:MAG: hypothetical protein Q9M32_03185 [Sulfurimonas sp.]|nr:hypothetical protein [Sulfurimonas sp.]MDQ7060294.1 hypothetical protein [Sulfurimonas sp.]